MTTLTALSSLIGRKRVIKVKDNFKFFLHRRSPWGSLGEAQVSSVTARPRAGDRPALTPAAWGPLALCAQSPHPQQEEIPLHGAREGQREWAPCGPHAEHWVVGQGRVHPIQPAQNEGGTGLVASACPGTNPGMARFLLGKPGEASSASPDSEMGCAYLAPPSIREEHPGARPCE